MQDLESMFLSMESTEEIYQEWENVDGYLTVPYSDDNIVYINNKEVGDMSINVVIVDESFSQYVQFEAPRYEDGVDLSQKRIYVHWEQGDGYAGDNVEAVNVKCTDDVIRFGWVVPAEALTINEEIRIMPFATGSHNGNNYVLKTLYGVLRPKESLKTTTGIIKPNEEWFLSFERKMSSYVEQGADLLSQTRSSEEQTRAIKTFMDDSIFAMAIVNEESGELIQTDDAANMALYEMSVFGKSQQFKTTGAQLLPYPYVDTTKTVNGITFTDNGDGSITVNGIATASAMFTLYKPNADDTFENTFISGAKDENCILEYTNYSSITFADTGSGKAITSTHNIADFPNTVFHLQVNPGKTVNNVTIYPMLNTGDKALPWEPYTGGKASPNPDYPQEVVSPGDAGSLEIGVYGGNLFDSSFRNSSGNISSFGGTATEADGVFSVTSTETDYCVWAAIPVGKNYNAKVSGPIMFVPDHVTDITMTLSNGVFKANFITFYDKDLVSLRYVSSNSKSSFTAPVPEGARYFSVRFGYDNESQIGVTNSTTVMVNFGTEALPWEPYTKQSVTFSTPNGLSGIPVDSGGNYIDANGQQYIADEIRLNADGTGVWVHNVGVIDFNGLVCVMNEFPIDSGIYRFEFRYADNPNIAPSAIDYITTGYCTALSYRFNPLGYNDVDNAIVVYDKGGLYARCDQFETADDFLAHMQSIDAKVYYILAEPYETELSAEEIEAFLLLRMNKYINNVFNDEGAYQRVKYIADPKMYIDNKIAEAIQTITEPV